MAKRSASDELLSRMASKKPRADAISTHGMLTRGITTAITRNAVIQTQELLEGILQHLPLTDLIAYRRVSKHFKETIDCSPKLQTKMFIRSIKPEGAWVFDKGTKVLRPYISGDLDRYGENWKKRQSVMRPSVLNPLIFTTEEEARRPPLGYRARTCETMRFTQRPNLARTKADSIYHRMFLCQPPTPVVEFLIHFNPNKTCRRRAANGCRYWDDQYRTRIRNPKGVTFGNLIEGFRQVIQRTYGDHVLPPASCFRIHITDNRQSKMSRVWMLGAIFASDEEKEAVEGQVEIPKPLSPMAMKMARPSLRNKEGEVAGTGAYWNEEDFAFAVGADKNGGGGMVGQDEIEPDYDGTARVDY